MIDIEGKKLLLVEGKDDLELCELLFKSLVIHDVQIHDCKGRTNIGSAIKVLSMLPRRLELTHVAAICDADLSVESARQSLSEAFRHIKHSLNPGVETHFFVSPDDASLGAIEDLFIRAIDTTPAGQCVQSFYKCLQDKKLPCAASSHLKSAIFLTTVDGLKTKSSLSDVVTLHPELLDHPCFNQLKIFLSKFATA